MERKEFKIGEIFQFGRIKLRVEETNHNDGCVKCFFNALDCSECILFNDVVGNCLPNREDGKNVIFVKVEENERT